MFYHLDGARIFNALAETGEIPIQYGKIFDSISICLSKGLGAPVGSLLIGNKQFIKNATRVRKVLGGGMRQAGMLAGAGIYALENNIARLKEDHERAKVIGAKLSGLAYVEEVLPIETNIIVFRITDNISPQYFIAQLAEKGVKVVQFGPQLIRMVTHLDFSDEMLDGLLNFKCF